MNLIFLAYAYPFLMTEHLEYVLSKTLSAVESEDTVLLQTKNNMQNFRIPVSFIEARLSDTTI
jgi:hypothetical protein